MTEEKNTAIQLLETIAQELKYLNELTGRLLETSTATAETLAKIGSALAAGLQQPATANNGGGDQTLVEFQVDTLVFDLNDGKPVYKMRGPLYPQYGVRVWPEVLPRLGIDESTLKPGITDYSARVVAIMGDVYPKKVVGMADPDHAASPPPPAAPAQEPQEPQEPPAAAGPPEKDEYPF